MTQGAVLDRPTPNQQLNGHRNGAAGSMATGTTEPFKTTTERPSAYHWTDEEIALLKREYDGTMASCRRVSDVIGRSVQAAHLKARGLGLTRRLPTRRRQWTEEERQVLRRDFPQSLAERNRLAQRFGMSLWQLLHEAQRLGLLNATDYGKRVWTEKEDAYLHEHGQRKGLSTLAKRLGRTQTAVVVRIKRLGISRRERDGWFTLSEVATLLGVDSHWLRRRIDTGALRATYHHGDRPAQGGMRSWHIEEEDLREFVRRYPQDLNGRNVDMIGIVDLLAGLLGPVN